VDRQPLASADIVPVSRWCADVVPDTLAPALDAGSRSGAQSHGGTSCGGDAPTLMGNNANLARRRLEGSMTVGVTDWREAYAYARGLQAYIYGCPWVYLPRLRWQWVTQPVNPATTPYAALHHFWHQGALMDAQHREGGFPTIDTLSSVAWVDARREPVILSHP